MASETGRLQKAILLRAPRHRVWRALAESQAFGSCFGTRLEGPFVPGKSERGIVVPTMVEHIEPERLFSFRRHPHAIEPGVDDSSELTTLVAFELAEVREGTMLTVTESGFDLDPTRSSGHGVHHERRGLGYRREAHRALS